MGNRYFLSLDGGLLKAAWLEKTSELTKVLNARLVDASGEKG